MGSFGFRSPRRKSDGENPSARPPSRGRGSAAPPSVGWSESGDRLQVWGLRASVLRGKRSRPASPGRAPKTRLWRAAPASQPPGPSGPQPLPHIHRSSDACPFRLFLTFVIRQRQDFPCVNESQNYKDTKPPPRLRAQGRAPPPPCPVHGDQGPADGACGGPPSARRPTATCQERTSSTTGRCWGPQGLRGLPEAGPPNPVLWTCRVTQAPPSWDSWLQRPAPAVGGPLEASWSPGAPWAGTTGKGLPVTTRPMPHLTPANRAARCHRSVVYSRNWTDDPQAALTDPGPRGEGRRGVWGPGALRPSVGFLSFHNFRSSAVRAGLGVQGARDPRPARRRQPGGAPSGTCAAARQHLPGPGPFPSLWAKSGPRPAAPGRGRGGRFLRRGRPVPRRPARPNCPSGPPAPRQTLWPPVQCGFPRTQPVPEPLPPPPHLAHGRHHRPSASRRALPQTAWSGTHAGTRGRGDPGRVRGPPRGPRTFLVPSLEASW